MLSSCSFISKTMAHMRFFANKASIAPSGKKSHVSFLYNYANIFGQFCRIASSFQRRLSPIVCSKPWLTCVFQYICINFWAYTDEFRSTPFRLISQKRVAFVHEGMLKKAIVISNAARKYAILTKGINIRRIICKQSFINLILQMEKVNDYCT